MWWRLWGGDGDATLTLWFLFSFYNLDKNPSEESGEDLLFLNQLCSEPGLRTSAQAHPPPRHHQWFVWRQNEEKYKKIIAQLNISTIGLSFSPYSLYSVSVSGCDAVDILFGSLECFVPTSISWEDLNFPLHYSLESWLSFCQLLTTFYI